MANSYSCYSNEIESVSLRKYDPYDRRLTNVAYFSAITMTNISQCFTYKMAATITWHRYGTEQWGQHEFKVGGNEPCEQTVRLPDWSELVASYSRMKSAWGWANGGQPILVCYIRKYVIILEGGYSRWRPPTKILEGMCPRHPRRGWRQWIRITSLSPHGHGRSVGL